MMTRIWAKVVMAAATVLGLGYAAAKRRNVPQPAPETKQPSKGMESAAKTPHEDDPHIMMHRAFVAIRAAMHDHRNVRPIDEATSRAIGDLADALHNMPMNTHPDPERRWLGSKEREIVADMENARRAMDRLRGL